MDHYDLSEVQPIDGYVKGVLEYAVKKYDLKINTENPTRGERLEAALALDKGESDNGFTAMEVMVGRRVSSDDPKDQPLWFMLIVRTKSPDPRAFYLGFAHQYHPKTEEKK